MFRRSGAAHVERTVTITRNQIINPPSPYTRSGTTRLLLLTGLGVSALFLWLTLRAIDPAQVRHDLMDHVRWTYAIPFLAAYAGFFYLKSLRWGMLLAPLARVTINQTFPSVIIGHAANLLLPLQLGEILRTYLLGSRLGIPHSPILTTIILERTFDFLVILLLLAAVLFTTSRTEFPSLQAMSYVIGAMVLLVMAMLLAYLYRTQAFLRYARRAASLLPFRLRERLLAQLEGGARGLESFRSARAIAKILGASAGMWIVMTAATFIAVRALSIDAPLSAAAVALIFTVVGVMLPAAPGYVGTVQLSFLLALTPFNVDSDTAVAASIFYHTLVTVPPLLVALAACVRLGYTPRWLWQATAGAPAPRDR